MTDDASKAAQAYKISQRIRELSDAAPDFDMSEVWRDQLSDKFVKLADSMSSKEIDEFYKEYF